VNGEELTATFLAALADGNEIALARIFTPDVTMRAWRWDGLHAYKPRERVIRALVEERRGWTSATVKRFLTAITDEAIAVEFRIVADDEGRTLEHNRMAMVKLAGDSIASIDLYCAEPLPGAQRDALVPAAASKEQLDRIFAEYEHTTDVRKSLRSTMDEFMDAHIWRQWTGQVHPGTNTVVSARWTDDEADERIDEVIDWHRERGTGFEWLVGPWDTPRDLGARLERHGLLLAGDHALMARVGLSDLEIPVNPEVTLVQLGVDERDLLEAALQITAVAFQWGPEQIEHQRPFWTRRTSDPERLQYVALLRGEPVGAATVILRAGTAYLGGAATLPAHRGHHVYSTLLRKRMEAAHDLGYEVAVIHAGPMSRRVVEKYGFEAVGMFEVYGWMPVMDPTVIATLVQDD